MAVGHGYVAAGGQNSQLDVRRLAGGGERQGPCCV